MYRKAVSLHVLAIFAAVLPRKISETETCNYQKHIARPLSPLETYTIPLTSNSLDFLTILSITNPLSTVDLVKLSSVKNLVALEIVSPVRLENTAVDDRLVRAWSFAARDEGAFPVLRLLRLWNHEGITTQSLATLDSFPALAVYDIKGCNVNAKRSHCFQSSNWRACMTTSVISLLGGEPGKGGAEYLKASWQKPRHHPVHSWEIELHDSVAHIGELRKDQDLHDHRELEQQVPIGSQSDASIPIASLRLGPTLKCLEFASLRKQAYDLTFVRVDLTTSTAASEPANPSPPIPVFGSASASGSRNLTIRDAGTGGVPPGETTTSNIPSTPSPRISNVQQPMKRRKTGQLKQKAQDLDALLSLGQFHRID